MKALVEGFMSRQPVAYMLFGAGAMVAVAMEMLGVPALTFALGMYLPLELNTPALVGGFIAHFVTKRSERVGGERGRTMRERGVIIASGLMAGGALGGVLRRRAAAVPLVPRGADQDAVLRQRRDLAAGVAGRVRRRVPLPVDRLHQEGQDGGGAELGACYGTPTPKAQRNFTDQSPPQHELGL